MFAGVYLAVKTLPNRPYRRSDTRHNRPLAMSHSKAIERPLQFERVNLSSCESEFAFSIMTRIVYGFLRKNCPFKRLLTSNFEAWNWLKLEFANFNSLNSFWVGDEEFVIVEICIRRHPSIFCAAGNFETDKNFVHRFPGSLRGFNLSKCALHGETMRLSPRILIKPFVWLARSSLLKEITASRVSWKCYLSIV